MSLPHPATKADFDKVLADAGDKLVCVDFTATWCGPCKMIGPIFEQIAGETGDKAVFIKVDVDENDETSQACGISCMPTFQFYKAGEKVHEFSGADEAKIKSAVAQYK